MAIEKITDFEKCCGCGVCAALCPKQCITMEPGAEGFLYPHVGADCIECGLCQKNCPVNKDVDDAESYPRRVFACRNLDRDVLFQSSSGGFFFEIASEVIACGGVVFGVVFDAGNRVVHAKAETLEALRAMMGSKYVQSDKRGVWPEVKAALQTGRKVLFSGTPCEIGALRAFLRKDYDNLLCTDFICMGTPSPAVFARHLHDLEQRFGAPAASISFRNKKYGAYTLSLSITFANGKSYFRPQYAEPYVKSFHSRIYLRPSCHHCSYKQAFRLSDITMADFWGLTSTDIPLTMAGGVSMVIVHSAKGMKYFDKVKGRFTCYETDMATARRVQPMLTASCVPSPVREAFFRDFRERPDAPFSGLIGRYEPIPLRDRLRARLKTLTGLRRLVQGLKRRFPALRHM